MTNSFCFKPTIIIGLAALGGAETVVAGGFRLPDQDAFATGRGEAFVATADNPSAIYYNPAGITQLDGDNARIGVYGIYLEPQYKNPNTGATYDNESTTHAIPQLFYTHNFRDFPVGLGLGIYSPYGLGEKWAQDSGLRAAGTQSMLEYFTINPVVAAQLPWHLSLAAGLTVNYSKVDLQQGLTPVPDADFFRFHGDAWAVGYNIGAQWKPIDQLSFGVTYRSSTKMDYSGYTAAGSNGGPPPAFPPFPTSYSSAGVDFSFPWDVDAGISYRPTEKWNLEFDADYTDWSEVGNMTIHQSPPLLGSSGVPLTLDWQSSWYFEWGVTRYFDNGWHVSAGYIFNESSMPDAHYTPLVSDLDKHFFSVGAGYKGKHLSADVAYQFGYGPDRTVVGSAAPPGYPPAYHPADGTYSYISHAVLLSVGWHF